MENIILSHRSCNDGTAAAWAAFKKFGVSAPVVFCDYAAEQPWRQKVAEFGGFTGKTVYLLDYGLPLAEVAEIAAEARRVIWLDHHRTSFQALGIEDPAEDEVLDIWPNTPGFPANLEVHLNNQKAGCVLAWEHFHPGRKLPDLLRHIDDSDRWARQYPETRQVIAGLRLLNPGFKQLGQYVGRDAVEELAELGRPLIRATEQALLGLASRAVPVKLGDTVGLAVNSAELSSEGGQLLAEKSGTFGMTWAMYGNGAIRVSLRSIDDCDVSKLAALYGGGGHKRAAGFGLPGLADMAGLLTA